MKLRLAIAVGPGHSIAFEHAGPTVRIGRDPECELALQGEASTAVSRRHACIELRREGATLADTGSSNGTLLNDRLIEGAVPLRVGDRIQLGHTGATLTVMELDLGAPALGGRMRGLSPAVIGLLGVAAVAAVVAAVLLFRRPGGPEKLAVVSPDPSTRPMVPHTPPSTEKDRSTKPHPHQPPPPPLSRVELASYIMPDKAQEPSVLLQRQDEAHPWVVMYPDARVAADATLVGLPGYRSFLKLDTGLLLILWGNLPEFAVSAAAPESVVMLHAPPSSDFDLEFTLDRGRVAIANLKPDGKPARVRLRFLRGNWDFELSDATSELGLETWTEPGELSAGLVPQGSATSLAVFTKKGRVQLRALPGNVSLGNQECLDWSSDQPTKLNRQSGTDLQKDAPECWWIKSPDPKVPEVQSARLSLLHWCNLLGGINMVAPKRAPPVELPKPVIEVVQTQVLEGKDLDNQAVGVLILAALDQVDPLVDLLREPRFAHVRATSRTALQAWLWRGRQHGTYLAEALVPHGLSRETAERIVRLMYPIPEKALDRRQTYEELVACLDDDQLMIRDLGVWQLGCLWKKGRLPQIQYDPTWERAKRRPVVERLKKLIAQGKIPAAGRRP